MAELKYVDWDGLVYYDGKIKDYIADKSEDFLKMGGILSFADLPDPSFYNLNYIYKINEEFTSDETFDRPGYIYKAGTWVQVIDINEVYKYSIFNEETIGGTSDIDLSNYYTKAEVDKEITSAIESLQIPDVDLDDYYTKEQVDTQLQEYASDSDLAVLTEAVADVQASIEEKANRSDLENLVTQDDLKSAIDSIELPTVNLDGYATEQWVNEQGFLKNHQDLSEYAKKSDLDNYATKDYVDNYFKDNVEIVIPDLSNYATKEELAAVENKIPSVEGLASESYVNEQISAIVIPQVPTKVSDLENDAGYITSEDVPQPELFVVDYNAPNFAAALEAYRNGKLLLLTNAAPDSTGYAVMNYVRDDIITFTKFLMSRSSTYGLFNTYYLHNDNTWELAKEVRLNKVEATVDANNDITGLTIGKNTYDFDNFATTETVNQINETVQNIENTYVTNEILAEKNYVTNEQVKEVVTTEVETVVTEQIETKVTEVIEQKIETGDINVNADSINYDTF